MEKELSLNAVESTILKDVDAHIELLADMADDIHIPIDINNINKHRDVAEIFYALEQQPKDENPDSQYCQDCLNLANKIRNHFNILLPFGGYQNN
jgi:hypothetical protein